MQINWESVSYPWIPFQNDFKPEQLKFSSEMMSFGLARFVKKMNITFNIV